MVIQTVCAANLGNRQQCEQNSEDCELFYDMKIFYFHKMEKRIRFDYFRCFRSFLYAVMPLTCGFCFVCRLAVSGLGRSLSSSWSV